jgi:hypothetical protein
MVRCSSSLLVDQFQCVVEVAFRILDVTVHASHFGLKELGFRQRFSAIPPSHLSKPIKIGLRLDPDLLMVGAKL